MKSHIKSGQIVTVKQIRIPKKKNNTNIFKILHEGMRLK